MGETVAFFLVFKCECEASLMYVPCKLLEWNLFMFSTH